jgi:hypothetical protein
VRNWKRTENANVEQVLKRRICDLITVRGGLATMYPGIHVVRTASGAIKQYTSPYMPPGVADVIANLFGEYHEIEVKRPKGEQRVLLDGTVKRQAAGRQSDAQKARELKVQRTRGFYHLVTSLEQMAKIIEEARRRFETRNGGPAKPRVFEPRDDLKGEA